MFFLKIHFFYQPCFPHTARRTASLAFFNFAMVLNKIFRQQKVREFFNSKFNSSLTNGCQTEFLILKTRAIVIFLKKLLSQLLIIEE